MHGEKHMVMWHLLVGDLASGVSPTVPAAADYAADDTVVVFFDILSLFNLLSSIASTCSVVYQYREFQLTQVCWFYCSLKSGFSTRMSLNRFKVIRFGLFVFDLESYSSCS